MEANSFWLVSVEESSLSVSLLLKSGDNFSIGAIGPQIDWFEDDVDSFVAAIDNSLSQAATDALISSDAEPQDIAIILPPFWVGHDGRILPDRLRIIGTACKKLDLKPIGFIPNDEAIVEQSNSKDGFPSSFVLVNISPQSFVLSLIYLGKIKDRVRRDFDGEFNPSLLESVLLDLKSESTLPPQIIVFGSQSQSSVQTIKNFAWVGKKDIETFLHFPDVSAYNPDEIISIYAQSIASQLKISLSSSVDKLQTAEIVPEDEPVLSVEVEEENIITQDDRYDPLYSSDQNDQPLVDVDASELGFFSADEHDNLVLPEIPSSQPDDDNISDEVLDDNFVDPISAPPVVEAPVITPPPRSRRRRIHFSLPSIKFRLPKFSFFFTALIPLLILIPFFLTKANVEIFVKPYTFSKKIKVTLDSTVASIDWSKNIIPVEKKEFTVSTSTSILTTGKKIIGEKSQGEITIYNKQSTAQKLNKGTVLVDSSGKKYELVNEVTVAASSANFDEGIITLGQTKTVIQAANIGPEYNIDKSVNLGFSNYSDNQLIAKVNTSLTGGTKEEINAVSSADKKAIQQKINEAIANESNNKIKSDLANLSGVITGSMQNKRSRIEYSREVDEAANELSATVDATVSVFLFNPDQKSTVIKGILDAEPNFNDIVLNPDNFTFTFSLDEIGSDQATGSLSISGNSLPRVDTNQLASKISGKFISQSGKIIQKEVSRVYNYQIHTNMSFLDPINPLPFIKKNITITLKS